MIIILLTIQKKNSFKLLQISFHQNNIIIFYFVPYKFVDILNNIKLLSMIIYYKPNKYKKINKKFN
jgi:hypothetical protein